MDEAYHYPPDLLQLIVDTVPLLCRSKNDVLLFFRGAGVADVLLADLQHQLAADRASLNKYDITRTVLKRINEPGDKTLRERREVVRRIVEFEDYSTCWPNDQLKARGLVTQIRSVVNVKDSFTRMQQERQREASDRRAERDAAARAKQDRIAAIDAVRAEFGSLFAAPAGSARGTRLEGAVTDLLDTYGVLIREPFRVSNDDSSGVLEQVDGVIELDGHLYFVEVKWLSGNVDVNHVSRHLVRIYHRGSARGLFVSATPFTEPALSICREALQRTVVSLCLLEEIIEVLEQHGDLAAFLRRKVQAAQIDKAPFVRLRLRTSS